MPAHDDARVAAARDRGTLQLGATHDDVLGVNGVPTEIEHVINEMWFYGFSHVEFDRDGKLVSYSEADRPLHVSGAP